MNDSTKATLERLAVVIPVLTELDKGRLLGYGDALVGTYQRDAPDGGAAVQVRPGA